MNPEVIPRDAALESTNAFAEDDVDRAHRVFLWSVSAVAVIVLWIRPMWSSLWGDELGTWWTIEGSLQQTIQRTDAVHGQSPAFYALLWWWKGLVGTSEFALRLPSLFGLLLAALLLFVLAKRLFDMETAQLSLLVFVVWPQVVFAASEARPYALATMIAIAAALCLVTWLDTGRAWWAVLTVVLSASLPYLHPLAAPVLGAFAIYGIARVREGTSAVRARGLLIAGAIIAIALVPVVRELQQLAGRRSDWVVPLPLSITSVFPMIVPPSLLVVAVVLYLVWPRIISIRTLRAVRRSSHILLIAWFVLPTLVLIALALLSPVKLLWARYFIFVAPAGAILAGMALRSIGPARARRLAMLGLLALSVVQLASPVKLGDFRATAALERAHATDQTVVLYPASYTESLQPDWYEDPVKASFLASPLDYYPLTGDVVVLPQQLTPQDEAFVRARVEQAVATSDDVIAITVLGTSYDAWLDAYMTDRGYEREDLGTETFFVVTKYSKP